MFVVTILMLHKLLNLLGLIQNILISFMYSPSLNPTGIYLCWIFEWFFRCGCKALAVVGMEHGKSSQRVKKNSTQVLGKFKLMTLDDTNGAKRKSRFFIAFVRRVLQPCIPARRFTVGKKILEKIPCCVRSYATTSSLALAFVARDNSAKVKWKKNSLVTNWTKMRCKSVSVEISLSFCFNFPESL